MKTKIISLLAALALCFSFVACSDDDDPPPPDKGADIAVADQAVGEAIPDPDGTGGGEGTVPTGACTNAADGALLDTSAKRDAVAAAAGTCGQGCLAQPTPAEQKTCSVDCVKNDTGLSDGCATCYAETILCAIEKCLVECAADPTAAACVTCRGTNCDPAFLTCSGLPSGSDGGV